MVASGAPAIAASTEPTVPKTWPFPMHATTPPSPHGAVASDCALATKVGVAMLQQGETPSTPP